MSTEHAPRPRVAVTLGDPRGVGPEVVGRALALESVRDLADFVLVGPDGLLDWPDYVPVGRWSRSGDAAEAGRLAGAAVERAVRMALGGEVQALVTAPLDKAAFRAGGWSYPGHTEMLHDLSGAPAVGMMLATERVRGGGSLRVVLATTHVALRRVPSLLSPELLQVQTLLTAAALRDWWEIPDPRVALCALNPHASDGGLFGDEEQRIFAPALKALAGAGLRVAGPVPADTVFARAIGGEFDAVVAPYHDVGMAAFKTVSFGSGVNVTLGLPFPRTSPDHGTALDLAGRGVADPSSTVESIRLAVRLAARFDSARRRG